MLSVFLKYGDGSNLWNFTEFTTWKSKASTSILSVMPPEEALVSS